MRSYYWPWGKCVYFSSSQQLYAFVFQISVRKIINVKMCVILYIKFYTRKWEACCSWVIGRHGWQEYWWGKWVGWGRMRHNTGKLCQAQALKCILSTVELFLHALVQITPFLSQSLYAKSPSHRATHQNTDQELPAALRFIWFYKRWWFQSVVRKEIFYDCPGHCWRWHHWAG